MFGFIASIIFLIIIANNPVDSFKISECTKKCTTNVWKNTLHSEKVKLYNTVMPIFVLATPRPRDLQWYLESYDEEIDQYNIKRYSSVSDDQMNQYNHSSSFVDRLVWPMIEELFNPMENHQGLSQDGKKIQLFDLINAISANLTINNAPMLFRSNVLHENKHNESFSKRITFLKEYLQIDAIRRIPDCIYKIYYNETTSRRYIENFIIKLLNRLETNANKMNSSIQLTDQSNLDILHGWTDMRRDILVMYDLFDSFEKALQVLKTSDENYIRAKANRTISD
jgi:hypothetical protein